MNRSMRSVALLIVVLSVFGIASSASSLMISEIAWAGTAASSTDEWIELRNVGSEAIALAGWTLVFGETVIHLGEVADDTLEARTAVLAPGEFLVLERTNDESISDIPADLIYKGSLPNTGIPVDLYDPNGELVDSAAPLETGWPCGTASDGTPAYCTMERTSDGTWVSNDPIICNGLDANGAPLHGTPGQINSADVLAQWAPRVEITFPVLAGSILSGTQWLTWTASDPDGEDSALAISVFLSANGNDWELVIENLANMGSFSWDTTPYSSSATYRLRVCALDPEGYAGDDVSVEFQVSNGDS